VVEGWPRSVPGTNPPGPGGAVGAPPIADGGHRWPSARLTRHPLGPALGQCCGGAVSLVAEVLAEVPVGPARALRLEGAAPAPSLDGPTRIERGWLVEPVAEAREPLWIWGAGHVGRALVATLGPLEAHDLAWIDVARDRFPEDAAEPVVAAEPARLAARAPRNARHLIVTHSHDLDLALCDALLRRGFASCGLIGSATKWARFRSRLRALGHGEAAIARIDCPIGDPSLGKHPQAIAIGVAAALLRPGCRLRASA
jgi:xanthine dehydrogenase accessory factor